MNVITLNMILDLTRIIVDEKRAKEMCEYCRHKGVMQAAL